MGYGVFRSFAVEGPARSGKTRLLLKHTLDLLKVCPETQVLVLCSNFYRKSQFLEALQQALPGGYGTLQVQTYSSLVRNTLAMFWPCVEDRLSQGSTVGGRPAIFPELSGYEATEYLLKKILARYRTQYPEAFAAFHGSERNLVGQLVRRLRLRAENRLDRNAMRQRSQWLGEPCLDDVEAVLREFEEWSLKLRVLDNSRQMDVFHGLLASEPLIAQHFTDRIRHLVVDDVDETIPAQQRFIQFLAPQLETLVMAADIDGGTRRGYLNAYPYDWPGLKALRPQLETIVLPRKDPMANIAGQLLQNWITPNLAYEARVLPVTRQQVIWQPHALTRMEMIQQVTEDILVRLRHSNGHGHPLAPGDMAVVMPKVDALARLQLQQQLRSRGIALQVLTGTQRPMDNPVCRSLVFLLQLANLPHWHLPLSPVEFKGLLVYGLKLHHLDPKGLAAVVGEYRQHLVEQVSPLLPLGTGLNPPAAQRYQALLHWLEKAACLPLEEQVYSGFGEIISAYLSDTDVLDDLQQLVRSLYIHRLAGHFASDPEQAGHPGQEWLIQVKTGVVSDTPNKPKAIDPKAIVLGTPQKIIDFEIERPYHFWLDVTSREWSKTDNAPLYNAWVHSAYWSDQEETPMCDAVNQLLTRTRAGHITRTLMLYAGKQVLLYASELDDEGYPQTGQFHNMLVLPRTEGKTEIQRAHLRADQAPILSYQQGLMAITAVPGAGKTFANVELLLELIARSIAPEKILVLTYMDAAARTLLARLKSKLNTNHSALPVISTIHRLAFRMITEGDHAQYLGLNPEDIVVADDAQQAAWMETLLAQSPDLSAHLSTSTVMRAIQLAKSHRISPEELGNHLHNQEKPLPYLVRFIALYKAYQTLLRQQGQLDFTDLILYAIRLLEEHPEIRAKYHERFHVVIEDEAQDSSRLLQVLLKYLTEKSGNLIRTGDANQSIMSFSSADPSVFRDFILACQQSGQVVEMDQSARCAEPVMALANAFLTWANQDEYLQKPFHPILMQPVVGKNPPLLEPMTCRCFDTTTQEISWLVETIQTIQNRYSGKSIGVLVRNNADVLALTEAFQSQSIKAIGCADLPHLNPAFLCVVYVLKILENPDDTEAQETLHRHLTMTGYLPWAEADVIPAMPGNLLDANPLEIAQGPLLQLYYNLQDLMRYTFGQDICRLIVRLSDMFLADPQQRSIGYLCAVKAQQWVDQWAHSVDMGQSPLEWVNREFARCLAQRKLPFKQVQEVTEHFALASEAFVQVMTLHRAKGQEFDFVLMPGLSENNFPSLPKSVPQKEEDKLELEITRMAKGPGWSLEDIMSEKRTQRLQEETRLVYVGLTRARQGLFISVAKHRKWGKGNSLKRQKPSRLFLALQEALAISEPGKEAIPEETAYA